jgi:hypothetical protein
MKTCGKCGVWTCARCGWKRTGASLSYQGHDCARCGSTEGSIRPTRHHDNQWMVCQDVRWLP